MKNVKVQLLMRNYSKFEYFCQAELSFIAKIGDL